MSRTSRTTFYIQYALRNLWRSKRWSTFAMLSVAAGVATMVALRSLGLAIGDSLTSNIQSTNKGDITLERSTGPGGLTFGSGQNSAFDDLQLRLIRDWVDDNAAAATEYSATNLQIAPVDRPSGLFDFMTGIMIDPATYPPTHDITALQPDGASLESLLQNPQDIVISDNLAEAQALQVGDSVRVTGSDTTYTVRGIVPTEAEAGLQDIFAAFFGFAYFQQGQAGELGLNPRPNHISILMPEGATNAQIQRAGDELNELVSRGSGFTRVLTVPSILEQNEAIADLIGRFIVIMGLGAMLIGGVGIINTMLVMVRRRTDEIAALKTFGLKGRQIATLFAVEGLSLGLIGSVIGLIVGIAISRLTNTYGETFIQQSVGWQVYPEALAFGLVLGIVVTVVFGVMPVLTAVKVRPGIILRPNESFVPALGVMQSISVILFMVLALGVVAGQIIGPLPASIDLLAGVPLPQNITLGILVVAITLVILAVLVGLLWVLIWLIGKLPALGWVDLNLALRNLGTRRLRTATTLLAISTGIFAISSISFYGAGVREILQFTLTETFGGNVLILSPATFAQDAGAAENARQRLDTTLDDLGDAIQYRTRFQTYSGQMVSVGDQALAEMNEEVNWTELSREFAQASRSGDFDRAAELAEQLEEMNTLVSVSVVQSNNPDLEETTIYRGRGLRPSDQGEDVAVVLMEERMQDWGVSVGDEIVVSVRGEPHTLEVVGLAPPNDDFQPNSFGNITVPVGTLGNTLPNFQLHTVQTAPDRVEEVENAIKSIPFFFSINVELIEGVIGRVIDQFSALPFLVGILSLAAAAVIMANTVALATLERRRQIGILKSLGLKRRRVVFIMLLENVFVSLMGAVIGIGVSALGFLLLSLLGLDNLVLIPDNAQPVAAALVVAAVAIGGTATFLSASSAAHERVLNVLRYD